MLHFRQIFGIMEQFQKEHYKKVPQKSLEDYNRKVEAAKAKQMAQSKPQSSPTSQPAIAPKIEKMEAKPV